MKLIPILLLLGAAGVLGWIASRAPEPSYIPPQLEEFEPRHVPVVIVGDVPAGHVVRTFEVEGMCCNGCGGKLYDALSVLEGVKKAAVDFDSSTASALVPEDLDTTVLASALTFDKYSVVAASE